MRSIFAGILALTLLDAVVSSQESAERFGGIFTSIASVLAWVMDPTVPGIPDLSGSSSAGTSVYVPPGAVTPAAPKPNRGGSSTTGSNQLQAT